MNYVLIVLIYILLPISYFSQEIILPFSSKVEKNGKKLQGAMVTLMQGNKQVMQTMTGDDGFFEFKIPLNGEYTIVVTKTGHCTKKFLVSTRGVPPEKALVNFKGFNIEAITLFEPLEGIDYSVLNQPLVKVNYNPASDNFDYDEAYINGMLSALEKLRELEQAALKRQKELEEKYIASIKSADKAFQKKDWVTARAGYNQALTLKPNEIYPKGQLAQIEIIIKDQEALNGKAVADKLATENAEADRLAKEKANKELSDKKAAEDAAKKAAADKIAAEKAEAERLAKEKTNKELNDKKAAEDAAKKAAADKLAAEKAEAERLAKEKANKELSDKLSSEQAAKKAAADKLAAEKAEADRLAKEKANKELNDKLSSEETAKKAAADKLAAERAEAARLSKEKLKEKSLNDEAAKKAASDKLAAEKAEAERIANEKAATTPVNDKYLIAKGKADNFFNIKNYKESKSLYEEALIAKAADPYCKSRLVEIEKILQSDNASATNVDAAKMALLAKYASGITEETISGPGVVIIQRVLVKNNDVFIYQKKIFSWGGVSCFRDSKPIATSTFELETKP